LSLGSGEFVAVAEADAEADEEADADAEVEDEAVADSEAAVEALSEPEAEADASEVALEPQAASKAMELTPSTPSAARRVRFSDIVIPFSQSVIATSLAANPTGYRVEWTKREKRLTDKSVMTNYDAAEVADASAEAAAEEGAEAEPDAVALAEGTPP
jgi:excinuclease ABC, C subunit